MNQAAEAIPYENFWEDLKSGRFASMVKESAKGQALMTSVDVFNVIRPMIVEHDDVECLYVLFLDTKNKILSIEKMFSGTISQASIHPREIIKRMLALKSAALIMVHNHPSGCPEPSEVDHRITKKVFTALYSIQATLHEHIVAGNQEYYSFADNGQISTIKSECCSFFN